MASIHYCDSIEKNIVELSINETGKIQQYYEQGFLVILKDVTINTNFDFISNVHIPDTNNKRKKFFLTLPKHYYLDKNRDAVWDYFRNDIFKNRFFQYHKFRRIVNAVNQQILDISNKAFPNYNLKECPITWKFHELLGENIHIDNLEDIEKWPRLRVFCNVGTWHRIWGLSSHVKHYANKYKDNPELRELANSPYDFNMQLTRTAFGSSAQIARCQEPRHYVYFKPGEVWFLNSALTAHQVIYGNRLVIGSFIHSYDDYKDPSNCLPNILKNVYELQ